MMDYDNQLLTDVDGFIADVDAFKVDMTKGEASNAKTRIQSVVDKLDAFEEAFDKRNEVIMGV
jgi:hypothetical protein